MPNQMAKALSAALRESTNGRGLARAMKRDFSKDKIRKRQSYEDFAELWDDLKKRGVKNTKVLLDVHSFLDGYQAFRSATASEYAYQSVELLMADIKKHGGPVVLEDEED